MNKCIYCLQDNVSFNKEHVIPKTFGTFGTDTMTLIGKVCENCNLYFSQELELPLARYSVITLFKYGVGCHYRPFTASETRNHIESGECLDLRMPTNDHLNNAIIRIKIDDLSIDLVSQIGFKFSQNSEQFDYYSFDQLKADKPLMQTIITKVKASNKNNAFLIPHNDKEEEEMKHFLNINGIKLNYSEQTTLPLKEGKVLITGNIRINKTIKRGLAKIAFNYFAYISEKELPSSYIFRPHFDGIRKYIRYGFKEKNAKYIIVYNKPIIWDERGAIKSTEEGHFLAINVDGAGIECLLSLFKRLAFKVYLGKPKVGFSLHKGNFFNLRRKKVHNIIAKHIFDRAGIIFPNR